MASSVKGTDDGRGRCFLSSRALQPELPLPQHTPGCTGQAPLTASPRGENQRGREMLDELYSNSAPWSAEEFARLEKAWRLRNEVIHGFAPPAFEAGEVRFGIGMGRQLLEESRP